MSFDRWVKGRVRVLALNWGKALAITTTFAVVVAIAVVAQHRLLEGDAGARSDYWVGFFSSLLEDAIFFFVIALTVSLILAPEPQNRELRSRVAYLFDGEYRTDGALDHMARVIRERAAIALKLNVELRIAARDDRMNALLIEDARVSQVANMFHREDYEDHLDVGVTTDPVDAPPNGIFGEIVFAAHTANRMGVSTIEPCCKNIKIYGHSREKRTFPITLKPNEQISYYYSTWVWNLLSEPYSVSGTKYAELLTVTLENATGGDLPLLITFRGTPLTCPPSLAAGEKHTLTLPCVPPGTPLQMKFQ